MRVDCTQGLGDVIIFHQAAVATLARPAENGGGRRRERSSLAAGVLQNAANPLMPLGPDRCGFAAMSLICLETL